MSISRRLAVGVAMLILGAGVFSIGSYSIGEAHAEVDRSNPAVGGHVEKLPEEIEIFFTQEINADGTVIEIVGPNGAQVDGGDTTLDLMDPDRKRVTISIKSDAGHGIYTVRWTTQSNEDGEEASGSFEFTVGESMKGTPAASPIASPAASPSGSPTS
ncbi:MAG: copper resistance protein CopC [Thermomicrobiales bacterium]